MSKDRNVSKLHKPGLIGDIDYILHVDHELPMEWYTKLDGVKDDIAELIITHADAAVRRAVMHLQYDIASGVREEIGKIITRAVPKPEEQVVEDDPTKKW